MKTRKEQILTYWKVINPRGLQVLKQERRWNVDRMCNKMVKTESDTGAKSYRRIGSPMSREKYSRKKKANVKSWEHSLLIQETATSLI